MIGLKKCIGFPILNKNMRKKFFKSHRVYSINYRKGQISVYRNVSQQTASRPPTAPPTSSKARPHVPEGAAEAAQLGQHKTRDGSVPKVTGKCKKMYSIMKRCRTE